MECPPKHNCGLSSDENAGVRCLRKGKLTLSIHKANKQSLQYSIAAMYIMTCSGVSLEHGPNNQLNNNSLVITTDDLIGDGDQRLLCATDRKLCCFAESDGDWYLPNGTRISHLASSTQAFYVSRGNQTIGLNSQNVNEFPTGIYRCELTDDDNVTNHLYVGIYPQDAGTYVSFSCLHVRLYDWVQF